MDASELCFLPATELVRRIRARAVSVEAVMTAHLEQIARVNSHINAIVTLTADAAMDQARAADARLAKGEAVGPLHGLPVAHKDLFATAGVRTTFGSPIFADHVPDQNALIVERLQRAGAITVGKTNTPEFGAGSQTFNTVFGATRNPYDLAKTCGGSSGGAAAALACGMVPLADGSDMGGSLRNPAAFCNVVGFRPSPGRVPSWPVSLAWFTLSVAGPMARTVADVALMLSAIAGPDARSPIAIDEPGSRFAEPLDRDFRGVRVAWSRTVGGLPVDPQITAVLDAQRPVFADLGCVVEDAEPELAEADEVFATLRAWYFELTRGALLDSHRDQLKDTVVWDIEAGRALSGPALGRAEQQRTLLYHRMRAFFARYAFVVLPVTQVPPFAVEQPYPTAINDVAMETYIDWMRSCSRISVLGLPAISVPCGFTREGLPVGLQIIGRHHDDWGVLQLTHAFEQATGWGQRRPAIAW